MGLTFEWDPMKAEANEAKHGVSFVEAITVFGDPLARLVDDPEHSADEQRDILFGESASGRTAREMTRRERNQYERYQEKSG